MTTISTDESLNDSVSRGTRWLLGGRLISQFITLATLAVLYRLVPQEEFGRFGMVIPVIYLLRVFVSFGLNAATIQRLELSNEQVSGLFWFNTAAGVIVSVVTVGIAPLLGWIYRTDVVIPVTIALSGTALFIGLLTQHEALLVRKMEMARVVTARMVSQVLAAIVAVVVAWREGGVWALVAQQYVELYVMFVMVWRMEPWRPVPWRYSGRIGDLVQFGSYHSLGGFMSSLYLTIDKLFLSLMMGASPSGRAIIGIYSQCFRIMTLPFYQVAGPISGMMLPALSRAGSDSRKAGTLVTDFVRLAALILLPASVGMFVVAPDLMESLGGRAWLPAGRVLAALAPAMIGLAALQMTSVILTARGRVRLMCGLEMLAVVGVLIGCALGYLWEGSLGNTGLAVAAGYSLVVTCLFATAYLRLAMASFESSILEPLGRLKRPAAAALVMGAAVWLVRIWLVQQIPEASLLRLAVLVGLGGVIYGLIAQPEIRWAREKFFQFNS